MGQLRQYLDLTLLLVLVTVKPSYNVYTHVSKGAFVFSRMTKVVEELYARLGELGTWPQSSVRRLLREGNVVIKCSRI